MIAWVVAMVVAVLTAHTIVNAWLLRRPAPSPGVAGAVSVLLPVRDEAHRVGPCLESLLRQEGVPGLELIVLDDGSTDGTAELVAGIAAGDPRVRLLTGATPPPGWLGKPHACQQLADAASAGILVFVDADVVLAPSGLATAVGLLDGFDLVSPYPRIVTGGTGERLVQPLLVWSWLTFLPLRAMERSARPSLAAAGGQFLAVTRTGYDRAGGHAAVRDRVLEDIELARAVKRSGGRIALADGSRLASCRMYSSWPELVAGYTKSLWASFGSPFAAGTVCAVLLVLYLAPALIAVVAALLGAWSWAGAGTLGYLLGVAGRYVAARSSRGRAWPDVLAHPVSVVLFGWLLLRSYRLRGRILWKGRRVA
jgi:hypothetical protein